jgi:HK97 family phage prohead protease
MIELEQKRTIKVNGLEWKIVDADQGIIRGYLAVFNNIDSTKDRIRPGAFKKTIAEALQRKSNRGKKYLFPLLWMHDPEKPIGGFIDATEDKVGLLVTAQIDISTTDQGFPKNPLAMSIFSGYQKGYIDELSIGYKALQKSYDQNGIRDLTEIQLFEGSAVTMLFAANELAQVSDVKSASGKGKGSMEKKDFNDRYREERIKDWLNTDFNNLVCALKSAIIDMFMIGDEPQSDALTTILNNSDANKMGFVQAIEEYVQKGVDLDVANYLSEQQRPASYYSDYGYMSRSTDDLESKKVSKSTAARVQGHMDTLAAVASNHALSQKAINSVREDMMQIFGQDIYGQEGPASGDASQPENGTTKAANLEPQHKALNQGETDQQPLDSTDPEVDQLAAWLQQQLNNKAA